VLRRSNSDGHRGELTLPADQTRLSL
jgi:hypothetical protein